MKQLDARNAIRHRDYSRFDKVASFVLLISPIIMTYALGKYNYAFVLTSILAIISLLKKGFNIKDYPRYILLFLSYWLFVHIITANSFSELFSLGLIRIFLCYLMYFGLREKDFFYKTYCIICFIVISFFFLQVIMFNIFGYRIPGVTTILPLAIEIDHSDYFTKLIYGERSSSLFSEPAAFVEYIFPLLCIELFRQKKINKVIVSILVIALLLTESGTALFGLTAILLMFVRKVVIQSKKFISKFIVVFLSIVVIVFSVYGYSSTEIGQRLLDRQSQLDSNDSSNESSGFVRIYRGFYVFSSMSTLEQIVGNDSPSKIKSQITACHLEISEDESNELYFNTLQTVMIRTGYIGTFLFILLLVGLFRQSDYCGKSLVVLLFVLSFISSMLFTEVMAIYFLFILKNERRFAPQKR